MSVTVVKTLNQQGERVYAQVYRESPDGSGRLDLLIPEANSQTNAVSFVKRDKFTVGKDCVLPGEDDSVLGAAEREHFNRGLDTGAVTEEVAEDQTNTAPLASQEVDPADTDSSGDVSAKERKRHDREHPKL